jgi:hypothetical protein
VVPSMTATDSHTACQPLAPLTAIKYTSLNRLTRLKIVTQPALDSGSSDQVLANQADDGRVPGITDSTLLGLALGSLSQRCPCRAGENSVRGNDRVLPHTRGRGLRTLPSRTQIASLRARATIQGLDRPASLTAAARDRRARTAGTQSLTELKTGGADGIPRL